MQIKKRGSRTPDERAGLRKEKKMGIPKRNLKRLFGYWRRRSVNVITVYHIPRKCKEFFRVNRST